MVGLPDGRCLLLTEVQEIGEDGEEVQRELAMVSDEEGNFGEAWTVAEGLTTSPKIYWDHRQALCEPRCPLPTPLPKPHSMHP